jgi:putative transposase
VPSARRLGWDYRWAGVYAVTVCVHDRVCCLGRVDGTDVALSAEGQIVASEWRRIPKVHPGVTLDDWVLMPDHLHGILIFTRDRNDVAEPGRWTAGSLGAVIGQFKMRTTKRIRARRQPDFAWQERFYDQILRDDDALNRYRAYILDNPRRWQARDP